MSNGIKVYSESGKILLDSTTSVATSIYEAVYELTSPDERINMSSHIPSGNLTVGALFEIIDMDIILKNSSYISREQWNSPLTLRYEHPYLIVKWVNPPEWHRYPVDYYLKFSVRLITT
ncbi:hypothetical protein [Endozoicomonas sp. Mp262]|uniref:hypothetical protein n=1 Tax=Endozoicomonas sp. Mp262 TaxID=2919499 RepID=UPI0021DA0538